MKEEVFEWNEDTQNIMKEAIENRELDSATEKLKEKVDDELNVDFNQYNFDQIIQDRSNLIRSIQTTLSPQLETLEQRHESLEELKESDDFKSDKRDDIISSEHWDFLVKNYEMLRTIHSLTALMFYPAYANSQDIVEAIDIQQRQADQRKALEMINDHYDKFIDAADTIGRQQKKGMKEGMKEAFEELDHKVEEKNERIKKLKSEVEELQKKAVGPGEVEPLTEKQRELVNLVNDNPQKDKDWIAQEFNMPKTKVGQMESQIKQKGYQFDIKE